MPELKLNYFNVRARGELTRIMLAYAGKKYTENILPFEDWPAYKPETPLGQMPVLVIDGGKVELVQSMAISRYIARETGLAGKDSLQQAQVDMIATTCDDIMSSNISIYLEKDAEKKAELQKKHKETVVPNILKFLEKALEKNSSSSSFYVGKTVTMADLMSWHVLDYESEVTLDAYPKLKANKEAVAKLPKFAQYYKNRPAMPF